MTQEAFFSAYRSITRFRGGNIRAWLLTIVANGCRDQFRKAYRRRNVSLEELTEANREPESTSNSPEEYVAQRETS